MPVISKDKEDVVDGLREWLRGLERFSKPPSQPVKITALVGFKDGIAGPGFNSSTAEVNSPASPTREINPVFEFVRTWSAFSGPCTDNGFF